MTDVKNLKGKERITREFDKLTNDPDINNCFGVDYYDPDADNPDIYHWQITLIPPKGTNYEGGFFKIEAKFTDDYPKSRPKLKFLTRIYHCNIDFTTGHICLNSLKEKWNPSLTIEDILNHIIILLYKQRPESPMNSDAANLYESDKNKFIEEVKKNIKNYANINDYENLAKQNIALRDNCNCKWCALGY